MTNETERARAFYEQVYDYGQARDGTDDGWPVAYKRQYFEKHFATCKLLVPTIFARPQLPPAGLSSSRWKIS